MGSNHIWLKRTTQEVLTSYIFKSNRFQVSAGYLDEEKEVKEEVEAFLDLYPKVKQDLPDSYKKIPAFFKPVSTLCVSELEKSMNRLIL